MESTVFVFPLNFKLIFLLDPGSSRGCLPWWEGERGEEKKTHVFGWKVASKITDYTAM